MSGPCDEAEHANDPRCTGQARSGRADRDPGRRGHLRPRATRPSTRTTRAAPARRPAAATTTRSRPRRRRRLTTTPPATGAAATTTPPAMAAATTAATVAATTTEQRTGRRGPAAPSAPSTGRGDHGPTNRVDGRGRAVDHRPARRGARPRGLRHATSPKRSPRRWRWPRAVEPDLVLLDVMLPDGSGYDVCRELRARLATCRSSCSPRAARRPTASSASSSAPTTTWSSRSAPASWWRASAPSCAAPTRPSSRAPADAVRGRGAAARPATGAA